MADCHVLTCQHLFVYCNLQLHEAVEEAEEQRRQVQLGKKKTQRLTAEMQDIKLHLEEQMARNNELERKQRRSVLMMMMMWSLLSSDVRLMY